MSETLPEAPAGVTAENAPGDPKTDQVYYPALDGLRFFAFALVYLFHNAVPQWSRWVGDLTRPLAGLGLPVPDDLGRRLQDNGWAGVQMFFVLSGFLITALLLREERRYGRIDLRAFWVRRILRIWPLYYATVLAAFVVQPWFSGLLATDSYRMFLARQGPAFLLFLGNWSMGLRGAPPTDAISVLWSVCVEEQFYLFAPLLVVVFPRWFRVPIVLVLMAASIALRAEAARAVEAGTGNVLLFQFSTISQLDTLLAGVLLALLLDGREFAATARRTWIAGVLQAVVLAVGLFLMTRPGLARDGVSARTWDYARIWLWTASLIFCVVLAPAWLGRALAYPRLVWLGKVSFGLYMWHMLTIGLADRAIAALGWFPNQDVLRTIARLALTILAAGASYRYLERPFLRLKGRWTRVPSRPV